MLLIALYSSGARAGQIIKNVTFDPSKLTISYDTIDNMAYARIHYMDMASVNSNGHPVLPSDIMLFSVPYNAANFDVHCNVTAYVDHQLNADVYPGPQVVEENGSEVVVYNQKAQEVYGSNSFYPDSLFRALDAGFIGGGNKVLKTHLYPICYNPVTRTLRLATSVQLVINYDVNSALAPEIFRRNEGVIEKEVSITKSFVQNGDDVEVNAFDPGETLNVQSTGNNDPFPTYNYCIITSRELEPAFKKIIAMKRQKGISAGTVCIEDLMASPLFNGGDINYHSPTDETHILADSAGVVRSYLKYAFNSASNPTTFVLMGGKKGHAPVRYFSLSQIPTDIYYSDLLKAWNENGNILTGEGFDYDRAIYFWPQLHVGRLLCSNEAEIDNYSDKLYQYAFNPGDGDRSYLKRALFFSSSDYEEDCGGGSSGSEHYFDNRAFMENGHGCNFTGADLVNEMNSTRYAFISGFCDGEPQSMKISSEHLLTALDKYVPLSQSTVNENGNGLDNLTNEKSPAIFYSISPSAIAFDNSSQDNPLTHYANKYNLGESFTLGHKYGGVAFLGNTSTGIVFKEWSYPIEMAFWESMQRLNVYNLGVLESMSKVYYTPYYNANSPASRYNCIMTSHNLLGDPEVEMWTNEPQVYEGITADRYGSFCIVHGVTANDTIAYCDNNGNVGINTGMNGFIYLNGLSPSATVMVYSYNHIPYIAPLLLQNCDINNSQYVYASSFSAGRNVDPLIGSGNVTIKSGAVYEIDATDDILLSEGFIVENGATFAVKTPGKVTIDGCVFQSGAHVRIDAGKVEISGNHATQFDAAVQINQYVE